MTKSKKEDRRQSREDDTRCPRRTPNELFFSRFFRACFLIKLEEVSEVEIFPIVEMVIHARFRHVNWKS